MPSHVISGDLHPPEIQQLASRPWAGIHILTIRIIILNMKVKPNLLYNRSKPALLLYDKHYASYQIKKITNRCKGSALSGLLRALPLEELTFPILKQKLIALNGGKALTQEESKKAMNRLHKHTSRLRAKMREPVDQERAAAALVPIVKSKVNNKNMNIHEDREEVKQAPLVLVKRGGTDACKIHFNDYKLCV